MERDLKLRPLLVPFIIGIAAGITAKLVDIPSVTAHFPIFDDIMGRFGVWVWAAAIIAVLSKNALLAAARAFVFFGGMLAAYYGYTVLFLNFIPKSQILLWGGIGAASPFCGFLIWHVHSKKYYAHVLSSLPVIVFFTEWYFSAFSNRYWSTSDKRLLLIVYACLAASWTAVIPENKKRFFGLVFGLLLSVILTVLIQAGMVPDPYELLNV